MKRLGFTLAEILITLGIIGVVAALTAPALVQNAGNAKIGPILSKIKATVEVANEQIMHENELNSLSSLAYTASSVYLAGEEPKFTSYGPYVTELSKHIAGSSITSEAGFNPATSEWGKSKLSANNFNVAYAAVDDAFDAAVNDLGQYNGDEHQQFDASDKNQLDPTDKLVSPYDKGDSGVTLHFSDGVSLTFENLISSAAYKAKGSFKGAACNVLVDINGPTTGPNVYGKDLFYFILDNSGIMVPMGGKSHEWLAGSLSDTYSCTSSKVASGKGCAGSIFDNYLKVVYK